MWHHVDEGLPEPGVWVVAAEEDEAGFAYSLGEFLEDGTFFDYQYSHQDRPDHVATLRPTWWITLPPPPPDLQPCLFAAPDDMGAWG